MKNQSIIALLALFALGWTSAVLAEDDEDSGHFYMGVSSGYYKTATDRVDAFNGTRIGNHRTAGAIVGRQFNDDWSAEFHYFVDGGTPGQYDVNAHQLNIMRHWGGDTRFLVNFGVTDIKFEDQPTYFGFHVGAGASLFMTQNLELRGDIKLMYYGADRDYVLFADKNEETHQEAMGTVSLNYHFGRKSDSSRRKTRKVLGASRQQQTLPPIQQRQPIQPVAAPEPIKAAPAVVTPRSTHTLVNFGSDSINVEQQYGPQLDEISSEIVNTNSRAVVEGHTDNEGTPRYNKTLSMDRAIVVKRELKKRGVPSQDIGVVGYGEDRPVATNETEEGRRQNRRVEVKVYDKQ